MGGNSRALDLSGQIKLWKGRPAFAEKIDLQQVHRSVLQFDIRAIVESINMYHDSSLGFPIWSNEALEGTTIYNGSSMLFMDENISDKEFLKYKPTLGDLDITVPLQHKLSLWQLLRDLEGVQLTENVIYVGSNRTTETSIGQQINSVLEFKPTKSLFQIDWEFVLYEDKVPTKWSKFSKSANWDDMKLGIKGVFHKYLLRAITRNASLLNDVAVLTPSSGCGSEAEVISLTKRILGFMHLTQEDEDEFNKLNKELNSIRPKLSKPFIGKTINQYAFSILYGIRDKIQFQFDATGAPLIVDGKRAIKITPVENSTYIDNPKDIFTLLFQREPSVDDLLALESFTGLVGLIKDRPDLPAIVDEFIDIMWGIRPGSVDQYTKPLDLTNAGQALERDSWERDRDIKMTALEYLREHTSVKLSDAVLGKLLYIYYGAEGEEYYALRSGPRKEEE